MVQKTMFVREAALVQKTIFLPKTTLVWGDLIGVTRRIVVRDCIR